MIYSNFIMDYSKLQKYRGRIEHASKVEEGKNLSCGDEVTLYLVVQDDRIVDAKFEGHGCAISQASTNVMLEQIIGRHVSEVRELLRHVENMVLGRDFDESVLGPVANFYEIRNYPMRVKCLMLPWKTLENALSPSDDPPRG